MAFASDFEECEESIKGGLRQKKESEWEFERFRSWQVEVAERIKNVEIGEASHFAMLSNPFSLFCSGFSLEPFSFCCKFS